MHLLAIWSVTAGAWCGKARLSRPLTRSLPRRVTASTCTKDPTRDGGRRAWCPRPGLSCTTSGRASTCALARALLVTERSCPGRGGRKIGLCSPGRRWTIWSSATRASTSSWKTTAACGFPWATPQKQSGAPLMPTKPSTDMSRPSTPPTCWKARPSVSSWATTTLLTPSSSIPTSSSRPTSAPRSPTGASPRPTTTTVARLAAPPFGTGS